ncbi:MAG TPA: hypothetical protein VHP83_19635 [Aggregatilineaceae bacterium]|nr:hypothetical protein [Aggregatilineaceae bacterium]
MAIEQFEQWVRQSFAYLFTDYGFEVVSRAVKPGKPGQSLQLVLQAADGLILAYDDDGEANLLLGPRSAPLEGVFRNTGQWFYIRSVIDFFERSSIEELVQRSLGATRTFTPHDEQLADLGARFQPYCAQALTLFRAENFPGAREELTAYEEAHRAAFRVAWERARKK